MAKRSLSEELNQAVEAIMTNPDAPLPPVDTSLAELLRIAAELRDLPAEEFKARLKTDLQRRGSMTSTVNPIPEGYHTATPCLIIREAASALDFYKRAFGATELIRHADPSGKIMHAEFQVGDSRIAIADEAQEWGNYSPQSLGGSPVIMSLYVEDVDGLASQAVAAGAKVLFPVADQFYGDRSGRLADPFGHLWIVSTHKEDVSPEEMQERAEAWMREQEQAAKPIAAGAYRVEPYLPVRGATKLIDFLKQAYGAQETSRHARPDGTIAHADVQIGDSVVGTGDSELKPMPAAIHLYVPDADAVYQRALRAGATSIHEPMEQDYGERSAAVKDPFGNHWYIATYTGAEATQAVTHIPEGLHAVTPYLHPHGAPKLIDFLKHAFGAQEAFRAQSPDGTVQHAKIRIGESIVEMGEAHGPYQPMPAVFHLYVDDTDAVYRRALDAGALSLSEPADQPWGYRNAGVQDPCGNQWWINAPTDLSLEAPATREKAVGEPPGATTAQKEGVAMTPIPQGYHAVTPYLRVEEAPKLIDFLKQAFGATEVMRTGDPGGHFHAEVRIGDSMIMMGNAGRSYPSEAPMPAAEYLYVEDVDAVYQRALQAGATSLTEPQDKDWGDRMAGIKDPFGNVWYIAAHKKKVAH